MARTTESVKMVKVVTLVSYSTIENGKIVEHKQSVNQCRNNFESAARALAREHGISQVIVTKLEKVRYTYAMPADKFEEMAELVKAETIPA